MAFLLVAMVVALLLYVGTPSPVSQTATDANTLSLAQNRFTWVYSEVVIDEVLLLLLVTVLLVPLINQYLDLILRRKVQLAGPVRALAMLALVIGFLFFAFWVVIDLLGGYNGPGSVSIYHDFGLSRLALWDKQGVIGFLSFSVAVLGFIGLRARHGIGTAVREGVTLFAAPVIAVFELALWYHVPADMYWHVTTFASWSLGSYLAPLQFGIMTSSGDFVWGGNVFLLSNWFVLFAAACLFVLGVATRRKPSRKPFHRKR